MPFGTVTISEPEGKQANGEGCPVLYSSITGPALGPARYIKGDLIGRGACKTVYRAFDEQEGMEVAWNEISVNADALTSLDERAKDRIFGEIKLLKQLKHKNVLALYDWWYDKKNSNLVFITELLIDGSLRAYRRRHKNVDVSVLKRWGWQILQGLVYLHGHNPPIIHRDLKSDNIFVNGASGTLKIGDLGFATFKAGLSSAMSVIGTPEFMAPELYEEKYDEKVDIYSFGLCLLELATLEYPYSECRNAAQIFKKVTQGIPPQGLARIVDPELREFVLLCICQDPKERPEARMLLKHPFFEAIRENGMRAKLSAASMPAPLPTPIITQAPSGMISPQGMRTPSAPPVQVAAGTIVSATVPLPLATTTVPGAAGRTSPPVAERALVPVTTVQAATAATVIGTMAAHGNNSPLSTGVPPVMATLAAAAAALGQAAAQQDQLPHASSVTIATLPEAQAAIQHLQAATLTAGGRHTHDDGSAGASVWANYPVDWSANNSLEKGNGMQQDMRIAAAALTGSWRSSGGGGLLPLPAPPHSGSGATGSITSGQPSVDIASASASRTAPAPPAAAASSAGGVGSSSSAGGGGPGGRPMAPAPSASSAACPMGDMNEDVLLFGEESSVDGLSCRTSGAVPQGSGTAGSHLGQLRSNSSYQGGSAFSPSARLSLQRSKECSLVEDDDDGDSEFGEGLGEEEEGLLDPRLGQRVRLMCRNYHDNMLSFSMSFINNNGTRKKVGFQYDMDADTAAEVAGEMIENLSLNHDEAGYIASLIQKELARHQHLAAPQALSAALPTEQPHPTYLPGVDAQAAAQAQPSQLLLPSPRQQHSGVHTILPPGMSPQPTSPGAPQQQAALGQPRGSLPITTPTQHWAAAAGESGPLHSPDAIAAGDAPAQRKSSGGGAMASPFVPHIGLSALTQGLHATGQGSHQQQQRSVAQSVPGPGMQAWSDAGNGPTIHPQYASYEEYPPLGAPAAGQHFAGSMGLTNNHDGHAPAAGGSQLPEHEHDVGGIAEAGEDEDGEEPACFF